DNINVRDGAVERIQGGTQVAVDTRDDDRIGPEFAGLRVQLRENVTHISAAPHRGGVVVPLDDADLLIRPGRSLAAEIRLDLTRGGEAARPGGNRGGRAPGAAA